MIQVIILSFFLTRDPQLQLNHVRIYGDHPCTCDVTTVDPMPQLELCAWRAAQLGLSQRFSRYKKKIYRVKPPTVRYISKPMKDTYGWREKKSVVVVLQKDLEENWDSLVHEYAHYINRNMGVTPMEQWGINLYIDLVEIYPIQQEEK